MPPIRIGVLGLTHDHIWDNLPHIAACENAVLAGAADPNPELRNRAKREYGCPVFDTADQLFDGGGLDAVYVYASNAEGAELAAAAAERELHVLVEKPMAATLDGAERMIAAARNADVRLAVNWPFAWWPQMQHAIALAQAGDIGELWQVKYRAAHAGPKELGCSPYFRDWLFDPARNGAGALMDYCCYGAVLARVLLGMPSRVTGIAGRLRKDDITVEDNALLALEYPRAMATAEGSWTQVGKLTSYLTALYGSEGVLLVEPREGGKLYRATADQPEGEEISVPAPAQALLNSAEHFVHCIETGETAMPFCGAAASRDAQEILEAGLRSAARHASVSLPLARIQ